MGMSDWSSDRCSSDLHHHDIRRGTVQIGAQLIVENRNALAVVRKLLGGHIREVHHLLFPFQMKPKAFAPSASAEWRAGRSEEHTSELQSLMRISYAVFCLKKKKRIQRNIRI